jgi:chromosome partitioning protein
MILWRHEKMHLVVVNSQKGGSGKTTLCANLSVEAERVGDGPVYLIDTDPQGSLTKWHSVRKAEAPQRIEIPFHQIAKGIEVLREGNAAYCIIDTAPDRTEDTAALLKLADLVLVPIRPSPYDLWAAAATVELLKREGIPFLFVLNQVKANTSITAQAAAALSHHGPVAEVFVNDRVPYAAAMMDGRTATELSAKGRAAEETAALWQGIKSCLHGIMKKRKHEDMKKVLAHA